jgi:hypothetical protein
MLAPGAASAVAPEASPAETSGAVFERLDAAQMFNETGMFRGAAPLAKDGAAEAGLHPASAVPADPAIPAEAALRHSFAPSPGRVPDPQEEQARAQAMAAPRIGLAAGIVPTNAPTTSRQAIRAARAALAGQPMAAMQAPARTLGAARQSATAVRRSETAAMLVRTYLAKGGSAAAQVSVQAVEGGISLVARADKLSREERDKLRIEIGELLARHGLAVAEIMLNGEAGPSPKGRDQ